MSSNVVTSGRTDVAEFFQSSGIREYKKLDHSPLLVFEVTGDTVEVKVVERADLLLNYPDEIKVMAQWGGQWRSDYFQFTVGQFREHINQHPRSPHQIV